MIVQEEVVAAIHRMRRLGTDTQRWEVKEAVQGVPKSLLETISSFSNWHGGVIILGLSEKKGFSPAAGFDADKVYAQMQIIGDQLTPVIRMELEKLIFEGAELVVAQVTDLPQDRKPCFVTSRGRYDGSFIRSGDGDRHLSPYEVDRLMEGQFQPQYDIEPVERATVEDLNEAVLKGILLRARELFPRVFGKLSDETILIQLGILTRVGEKLCPTLAGLLATGTYPQQYFPRLQVVFTLFAGTSKIDDPATGKRYLDSKEIIGSIPEILLEVLALVQSRMHTGAVVEGGLRREVPDYPLVAVREAVANALQHRDYSPGGRGTHVQVNMYADRLEIMNPGGLYGSLSVDNLGKEGISSTRNEYLSRILTYTPFESGYVVENKGTGFMTIESLLANALMPPPIVKNSLTFFSLTFEKRRRTEAETANDFWGRVDEAILVELKKGSHSAKELMEMSGLSRLTIVKHLKGLITQGLVEPTENKRSPRQRYRLVRSDDEEDSDL